MDPTSFHPLFLVFFCVPTVTFAAHVVPPSNVTLHCRNLRNRLKWSYEQPSAGLRFKVNFRSQSSPPEEIWVDPPNLQADVLIRSDPSLYYYLSVTAVIGQDESDEAPPGAITFSYFENTHEGQKCFVDFPSVNVTAKPDNMVQFSFTHPWLLYHQRLPASAKLRKKKSHDALISQELPVFNYDVVVIHKNEKHHDFICFESVCEKELPVDAAEKHCLKMRGDLNKISVAGTREYCTLPLQNIPHGLNKYVYICVGISVLALIAVAFVIFMVYKKMSKPPTSLPSPLKNIKDKMRQWTFSTTPELVVVPEVEPASPTPLLPTKELTPTATPSIESAFRLRIGVTTEDEGVCDVEVVRDDEEPGYMGGRNMEADETPHSGYERRPVLVDLGPDDQAEGYRG